MPIYEYRCAACGHHLEALQKMTEGPLRKCPDCGKSQLRRLVSAPQFRLKGSGWYETDFKGDKETRRNLSGNETGERSRRATNAEWRKTTPRKSRPQNRRRRGQAAKPEADTGKSAAHGRNARQGAARSPRELELKLHARLRGIPLPRNIPASQRLKPPLYSKG
jgi:putative FmdB family regulatory protein